MGAATLISLVLSLLQSVLASAKVGGVAPDVIANIEGAVSSLAVQRTPVTFAQLEGLRVTRLTKIPSQPLRSSFPGSFSRRP